MGGLGFSSLAKWIMVSFTDNVTIRKRERFGREDHRSGLIMLFLKYLWETQAEMVSKQL